MRLFVYSLSIFTIILSGASKPAYSGGEDSTPETRQIMQNFSENPESKYVGSRGFYTLLKASTFVGLVGNFQSTAINHFDSIGGVYNFAAGTTSPIEGAEILARAGIFVGSLYTAFRVNQFMKGGVQFATIDRVGPRRAWFDRPSWVERTIASSAAAYGFMYMAPHILKGCASIVSAVYHAI